MSKQMSLLGDDTNRASRRELATLGWVLLENVRVPNAGAEAGFF